jgi:mannobiose 2-epimerase
MKRRLFFAMPLAAVGAPLLPTRGELDLYIQRLEKTLFETVVGFWQSNAMGVVPQAQMVWFFARMARLGHEPKKMLEAATQGYRYLREKHWDARNGGFHWELDAQGKPTKSNKHVLGQSFALYAMAEYAMASRRKDVLEFALKFFELLEKKSHDPVHAGYVEYFLPDWSTPPVNEPIYVAGSYPGMKLMSTHLHLLEAMTALYRATKDGTVRERVVELVAVQSNAVIRKPQMMATDKYDRDWSVRLEGELASVSYGHDLENIWALMEAAEVAGLSSSPFRDLFRVNFEKCRKYGFDEAEGGFYASGPLDGAATNRSKVWWVQAEALVSALAMYQITSSTEYFEVFRKTWRFCDPQWAGGKVDSWRSAFHAGRAMVECVARLKAIREKTS